MPTRAASGSPPACGSRPTAAAIGEPGPDRPLGLVLVRLGPAEIGEHAVAHELGDVALEARDLAGDGVLVGADDLAHLLGVEPRGERGRADQVDEHHRELAALGLERRRGSRIGRRCGAGLGRGGRRRLGRGAQGGDRLEHPAPVADDGDADVLEVVGGQLRQDLAVDVVVAERLGVMLQTEAA